jgi:hypothetical protein
MAGIEAKQRELQLKEAALAAGLAQRLAQLDAERTQEKALIEEKLSEPQKAREILQAKLEAMEHALLHGGNLSESERERTQRELQAKAAEAAELRRAQAEASRLAEAAEEGKLLLEEQYTSAKEEALAKTKKLKKLANKYKILVKENEDLQAEFANEREDLLGATRHLSKEISLLEAVCESLQTLLPPGLVQRLRDGAVFDSERQAWRILALNMSATKTVAPNNNVLGVPSLPSLALSKTLGSAAGSNIGSRDRASPREPLSASAPPGWASSLEGESGTPPAHPKSRSLPAGSSHLQQRSLVSVARGDVLEGQPEALTNPARRRRSSHETDIKAMNLSDYDRSSTLPQALLSSPPPAGRYLPQGSSDYRNPRNLRLHPLRPHPDVSANANAPTPPVGTLPARRASLGEAQGNTKPPRRERNTSSGSGSGDEGRPPRSRCQAPGETSPTTASVESTSPRRWSTGDAALAAAEPVHVDATHQLLKDTALNRPTFAPASNLALDAMGLEPRKSHDANELPAALLIEPEGFATRRRDSLMEIAERRQSGSNLEKDAAAVLAAASIVPRRPSFSPKPPPDSSKEASGMRNPFAAIAGLVRRPSFNPIENRQ